MNIKTVYEDDSLVVVDKPSGVVVNRAESVKGETIQDWAEKKYQILKIRDQKDQDNQDDDFYNRAGIVHRLDKDTSGLLIIAKNPETFHILQLAFKERTIAKHYQTLVHGDVVPDHGEIIASVGRLPWNRERFGVLAGGRDAQTSYQVLSYYSLGKEKYSLLEASPHTGRTHQIRIHLKYIGHSVVADPFYAGRKTNRSDLKFCPRLFLHAAKLEFPHPLSGETIKLESPTPQDLQLVLSKLQHIEKKENSYI